MRRSRIVLASLLASLILAGFAGAEGAEAKVVMPFVGQKAAAILRTASKVEVFRIAKMRVLKPEADAIEGHPLKAKGKDQDQVFAAKLAAILLDNRTYSFDSAKGCIFQPGIVFRVHGGEGQGTVDVIVCFDCTELRVITRDADGKTVKTVGEDFDNARPALVALAKAAFPDDAEIQALKE